MSGANKNVPMPRGDAPNWHVVAKAYGMIEASIITGRLQSLGIPAYIQRESAALAILGDGPGAQVRVLVPEEYYEMAMAALDPDPDTPWLEDGEDDEEDDEFYDDDEDDYDEDEDDGEESV